MWIDMNTWDQMRALDYFQCDLENNLCSSGCVMWASISSSHKGCYWKLLRWDGTITQPYITLRLISAPTFNKKPELKKNKYELCPCEPATAGRRHRGRCECFHVPSPSDRRTAPELLNWTLSIRRTFECGLNCGLHSEQRRPAQSLHLIWTPLCWTELLGLNGTHGDWNPCSYHCLQSLGHLQL